MNKKYILVKKIQDRGDIMDQKNHPNFHIFVISLVAIVAIVLMVFIILKSNSHDTMVGAGISLPSEIESDQGITHYKADCFDRTDCKEGEACLNGKCIDPETAIPPGVR